MKRNPAIKFDFASFSKKKQNFRMPITIFKYLFLKSTIDNGLKSNYGS